MFYSVSVLFPFFLCWQSDPSLTGIAAHWLWYHGDSGVAGGRRGRASIDHNHRCARGSSQLSRFRQNLAGPRHTLGNDLHPWTTNCLLASHQLTACRMHTGRHKDIQFPYILWWFYSDHLHPWTTNCLLAFHQLTACRMHAGRHKDIQFPYISWWFYSDYLHPWTTNCLLVFHQLTACRMHTGRHKETQFPYILWRFYSDYLHPCRKKLSFSILPVHSQLNDYWTVLCIQYICIWSQFYSNDLAVWVHGWENNLWLHWKLKWG